MGRPKGRYHVSLEEYMDFLENPHCHDLTNTYLNQIISIQGFNKIQKQPKMVLVETLNTMGLLEPCRSTLKETISSSNASLTADVVITDLDSLGWTECSLQSIETLNLSEEKRNMQTSKGGGQDLYGHVKEVRNGGVKNTRKRKAGRKRRSVTALCSSSSSSHSSPVVVGTSIKQEPSGSTGSSYWLWNS